MANEKQLAILRQGVEVWNKWREANSHIEIDLSGADIRDTDISGINLSEAILRDVRLRGTRLVGAKLCHADFSGADLRGADISGADISGANLRGARVRDLTYHRKALRGRCYGVRVDDCFGDAIFKRDAQDQDYIDTLEGRCTRLWQKILFKLWGWMDFGRSMPRAGSFALTLVFVFGTIYKLFPHLLYYGKHPATQFTPYYFSFVTYTTLGFGDVTARGVAGEVLVTLEVMLGYLTLGLLLAILANTVARRS
jgi:hypothetical protein